MEKLKVGIIGVGGMGATHNSALKALSQVKNLEVTAIADRMPEHIAKAAALWPEARIYEEGMELLEKEKLDCVHICMPSYLHTDYAVAAMEREIHVLVEKPVCLTLEDCDRLLKAKEKHPVQVMVGQVVRFFPEYLALKEVYEKGTYGKLKSLVMQRLSQDVRWGYEDWFHDEAKSGSVVLDLHIHDADFIRYLLGEPEGLSVKATAYESGMINHILTWYDYPGIAVSAEGLWDVSPGLPFHPSFRASFEEGILVYDGRKRPTMEFWKKDGTAGEVPLKIEASMDRVESGINIKSLGSYYTEIAYFYDCLEKGVEPKVASLEEGIRSVKLVLRELALAHEALKKEGEQP